MIKFEDLKASFTPTEAKDTIINFNDIEITVKKSLSVDEKMKLASYVLAETEDDRMSYFHPIRFRVAFVNAVLEFYTDIELPEETTTAEIYDFAIESGLMDLIDSVIGDELETLFDRISETAREIYTYKNSLVGVMEKVTTDYGALSFDSEQIRENLSNPENLELLRNIMDRFG